MTGIEYGMVSSTNLADLAKKTNKCLANGWMLHGGIGIREIPSCNETKYYQSLYICNGINTHPDPYPSVLDDI